MDSRSSFRPKPGQADYTNVRFAPVINCVLRFKGKILIVRRSKKMNFYPNRWNGIGGYLDDGKTIEEKVSEELKEELGIGRKDIVSIRSGKFFEIEEPKYKKVWIMHPVLVEVRTDKVKLNWEADDYRWIKPAEAKDFKIVPIFGKVLENLFAGRES